MASNLSSSRAMLLGAQEGEADLARSTSTLHSHAPKYKDPSAAAREKYIYAGIALTIALVSFVVQTESAAYIQHELHWDKAYCMLWLTHGSWVCLWPIQLLILRIQKRRMPWSTFWRRHVETIHSTAQTVAFGTLKVSRTTPSPWPYFLRMVPFITTFLTMAGGSWYLAINMTSPSDLTAIYNCNAFFAYAFSIWLLHDRIRLDKLAAVFLAIVGVIVVAYGDSAHPKTGHPSGGSTDPTHPSDPSNPDAPQLDNQFLGNIIIGIGSVAYGLYEVLYKKWGCPPDGLPPNRGMLFANTFGSMVGFFTLTVLWFPLPILHHTGLEVFVLPTGYTAFLLVISTLSNAIFSGSFLVLMSLTSPVLSSVAALLTIFLVAIVDWLLTGKAISLAALAGGLIIIFAFLLLSWATWREMNEESRKRAEKDEVPLADSDDEDDQDEARDRDVWAIGDDDDDEREGMLANGHIDEEDELGRPKH